MSHGASTGPTQQVIRLHVLLPAGLARPIWLHFAGPQWAVCRTAHSGWQLIWQRETNSSLWI